MVANITPAVAANSHGTGEELVEGVQDCLEDGEVASLHGAHERRPDGVPALVARHQQGLPGEKEAENNGKTKHDQIIKERSIRIEGQSGKSALPTATDQHAKLEVLMQNHTFIRNVFPFL